LVGKTTYPRQTEASNMMSISLPYWNGWSRQDAIGLAAAKEMKADFVQIILSILLYHETSEVFPLSLVSFGVQESDLPPARTLGFNLLELAEY